MDKETENKIWEAIHELQNKQNEILNKMDS